MWPVSRSLSIFMKDRFSDKASGYATFRPTYPEPLFQFIYSHLSSFDIAWDAGSGNGQVAGVLAGKFNKVYATDISIKQLMRMPQMPNLSSFVADETAPQIPDQSVDLVTVAQAIHWFDLRRFSNEVERVCKPGARLAVWGYGLIELPARWQPMMHDFYTNTVGQFWDPERKHIDTAYREISVPFSELSSPLFSIDAKWTVPQLEGYVNTWSAVGNYIKQAGGDPVASFVARLVRQELPAKFKVRFPVFVRLFEV